ncbi:glycoside hydrolase family 16 protein [Mycolicibacterium vaccae]|uniref:glycoside hydrolase family 16 protein n=1 Tax=Mycolicibacterium vaccae TaxID=1810 RepID=UPI003CFC3911
MLEKRPTGIQLGSGKHWFAGGVVAAGLGAALMAGAAPATADPGGDRGATAASSSGESQTPREQRTRDAGKRAPRAKAAEAQRKSYPAESKLTEDLDVGEPALVELDVRESGVEMSRAVVGDSSDTDVPTVPDTADKPVAALAVATRKELRAETDALTSVAASESRTAAALVETTAAAAPVTTRVTVGSMIVDWLYSVGVKKTKYGPDFLAIPVPRFVEKWWLGVRARIYRDVAVPVPGTPNQPSPQQKPLWETNFSSVDEAMKYWGFQTGRWGGPAGENQYYTDGDNVTINSAGNLVIEARRESAPDQLGAPYNYTSARVVTFGKQSIAVGTRVVARIQMPVNQGVLPAFWTVGLEPGHEYDWPRQGEIDIAEVPGFGTPQARRIWTGNIHGPADRDNTIDVKLPGFSKDLGVDVSQGFHEYGIDWYSDRIIWHVDGAEVGRVTKAQYEALGGDWTPFSGAWDHYLILNVAVGNPWIGDPPADAPLRAQMKVDWVKAYAL